MGAGIAGCGAQAGDSEDRDVRQWRAVGVGDRTFDEEHLLDVRKGQIEWRGMTCRVRVSIRPCPRSVVSW
jgi:hypothetical protein